MLNNTNYWIRIVIAIFVVLTIISLTNCKKGSDHQNATSQTKTTEQQNQLQLVWADEFNDNTLNKANWSYETGYGPYNDGWGNNESQLYTTSTLNIGITKTVQGDSYLYISARCDSGICRVRDNSITSAKINSKDKFEFRYGKVQARIKVPNGKSIWSAFWMLGANFDEVGWPRCGEIDIMESFWVRSNDKIAHTTLHFYDKDAKKCFGSTTPGHSCVGGSKKFKQSLSEDFHIYAVDWNENRIIGSIDGNTYFTKMIDKNQMSEFLKDFYLILNVAVDGNLGHAPDAIKTTPQVMLVDWIRVYQTPSSIGSQE